MLMKIGLVMSKNIFTDKLTFAMTPERRFRYLLRILELSEDSRVIKLSYKNNITPFFYIKKDDKLYVSSSICGVFEDEFDMTSLDIRDLIRQMFSDNIKLNGNPHNYYYTYIKIKF